MKKNTPFILMLLFLTNFYSGYGQSGSQKKKLKKLSRTYKLGNTKKDVFYIQHKRNKLYGIASIEGKIILTPQFKWISKQNSKGHFLTANNKISSPNDGGGSFALQYTDITVYDISGKVVNSKLQNMFLQARGGGTFNDDYLHTIKSFSGKMGLINSSGEMLIKPQYDFIGAPNSDGLGYLFNKNKYGVYDLKKNNLEPINYIPPVSGYDIKDGLGFKGANQPALSWKIKNNCIITSKNGRDFGLLDYNTNIQIYSEEYGYNFEQKKVFKSKNTFIIKARSDNRVSLYDSSTNTMFFDGTGFDDVVFFSSTENKEWVNVSKGYEKNLYNIKTKSLLMDKFQKRISILTENMVSIENKQGTRMFSLLKRKYLNDKIYSYINVVTSKKLRSYSNHLVGPNYLYEVKLNNKIGLVDENGNELTEIKYNSSVGFHKGIFNKDKTKIFKEGIVLTEYPSTNNGKVFFHTKTNKIIFEGAYKVIFDGTYIIKKEMGDLDPIAKVRKYYYTAYDLDGNKVSKDGAYILKNN